jgi:hypothetical protein
MINKIAARDDVLRQPIAPRNIWKEFSNFRTLQSTGTMLSVARLKLHALA